MVKLVTSPKSEPALELISRASPSVEAHHRSVGPDKGRNSGGRQIIKKHQVVSVVGISFTNVLFLLHMRFLHKIQLF